MNISRREYIKYCLAMMASVSTHSVFAASVMKEFSDYKIDRSTGNFRYIYSNQKLRDQFLDFYTNVFHLYPEKELHNLVYQLTLKLKSDDAIYKELQASLSEIKPFLADFRYSLPALAKQKKEMTRQTLQLLDRKKRYEGYMEIGTTGRYLGQLEDMLTIGDERYLLHTVEAGYSPLDIIDRGQLTKIAQYVDMGQYSSAFSKTIKKNSLELVTVYIGFHHCPLTKREEFISAVRDVIKPGGTLILRDHDARNEDNWRIAALAHDTFNAGTSASLESNHNEVRNFYSLKYIITYLGKLGLRYEGKVLFQKGDPTRNGLMAFTRT